MSFPELILTHRLLPTDQILEVAEEPATGTVHSNRDCVDQQQPAVRGYRTLADVAAMAPGLRCRCWQHATSWVGLLDTATISTLSNLEIVDDPRSGPVWRLGHLRRAAYQLIHRAAPTLAQPAREHAATLMEQSESLPASDQYRSVAALRLIQGLRPISDGSPWKRRSSRRATPGLVQAYQAFTEAANNPRLTELFRAYQAFTEAANNPRLTELADAVGVGGPFDEETEAELRTLWDVATSSQAWFTVHASALRSATQFLGLATDFDAEHTPTLLRAPAAAYFASWAPVSQELITLSVDYPRTHIEAAVRICAGRREDVDQTLAALAAT